MGVVIDISHRVMVLEFGRKIAEGHPAEVLANEHVKQAYLGEEDGRDQHPRRVDARARCERRSCRGGCRMRTSLPGTLVRQTLAPMEPRAVPEAGQPCRSGSRRGHAAEAARTQRRRASARGGAAREAVRYLALLHLGRLPRASEGDERSDCTPSGSRRGDVVGLIGDNRPDWVIGEIAAHALRRVESRHLPGRARRRGRLPRDLRRRAHRAGRGRGAGRQAARPGRPHCPRSSGSSTATRAACASTATRA